MNLFFIVRRVTERTHIYSLICQSTSLRVTRAVFGCVLPNQNTQTKTMHQTMRHRAMLPRHRVLFSLKKKEEMEQFKKQPNGHQKATEKSLKATKKATFLAARRLLSVDCVTPRPKRSLRISDISGQPNRRMHFKLRIFL